MTMTYYTLGNSGLRVSRLALGTMTFGTEWGWGADKETARAMFDAYVEAGGNFFDTADLYTGGTSETWLGEFIAERGLRDRGGDRHQVQLSTRSPAIRTPAATAARTSCARSKLR